MKLSLSFWNLNIFIIILTFYIQLSSQQDCSAANPCPLGCCSSSGWCGMGPDYCGQPNCVSTCDAKSECDPGWGSSWSNSTKCPLNVCCSKFGFCGTTNDFCNGTTVDRPSCSTDTKIEKVIGYYESWSFTERLCGGMTPEQIPYGIYTHINFAFATIDPSTFEVKASSSDADDLMRRMKNVKILQNGVQLWVAIGGWTFNDAEQPTANVFSQLAASTSHQDSFANSLISMMNTYGFDGVDIDWEYPQADDRNGKPEDYKNFVSWMKSLKAKLGNKGLSITIPSSFWYMQHFDIVELEKSVDWFNVMLYDLHGSWDLLGKFTGPFVNPHTNLTEIQDSLDLLWRNKINPDKLVFGMAFYGRSFTLTNPSCSTPGCTFASGGNPGECSNTAGVLLNTEIQKIIDTNKLAPVLHQKEGVKTLNWGNQWVSYDDAETWAIKSKFLKGQCLKNIMVWAISHDDHNGTYAKQLTGAVGREVMVNPDIEPQAIVIPPKVVQTCRWTNCDENCPDGWKNVPRDGTKLMMTDDTACLSGQHQFCCPADEEQPTCLWRGFKNSGACSPGCKDGEAEVGTLSVGCSSKHQSACCTELPVVEAYADCKWVGSAGLCSKSGSHASCPSDYPSFIVASSAGAGGEQVCSQGAKSYCCKNPAPSQWTDCAWNTKQSSLPTFFQGACDSSCPTGSTRIAMQKGGCSFGWESYCCKGKPPPTVAPRDPSFGNGEYSQLSAMIDDYMKYQTCPANYLGDPGGDYYHDSPNKRSDISIRQGVPCDKMSFHNLIDFMATLIFQYSLIGASLEALWNVRVADHFDTILELRSLTREIETTGWDANSFMTDVLLDPTGAAMGLRDRNTARTALCTYPRTGLKRTTSPEVAVLVAENVTTEIEHKRDVLEDRRIIPNHFGPASGRAPSVSTILAGIAAGALTLNYARWQYMNGGTHPGPMLEIAYWIGPTVGVRPTATQETALNLQQYRDTTRNRGGTDRWVVFHLHFVPGPNLLSEFEGNTYIGTPSIRMYHGQTASIPQRGAIRVDNQATGMGINSRSGLVDCPTGSLWYIGMPTFIPSTNDNSESFAAALHEWGFWLWDNHYVDSLSLQYIFDVHHWGPHNQIDLDSGVPALTLTRSTADVTTYNWRWNPATNLFETGPDVPNS